MAHPSATNAREIRARGLDFAWYFMARLDGDLLEIMVATAEGRLDDTAQREAEATAELENRQARIEALLLDLSAERDRSTELASELSDESERTLLAQQEIEEREIRLSELAMLVTLTEEERSEAQSDADRRLNQIGLLNQQLNALRDQIAALNELLEAAEAQAEADQVQIADLCYAEQQKPNWPTETYQ